MNRFLRETPSLQRPDLNSFGGRLRALRYAKGYSQTDLARLIGRHQTAVGPYERDEYMPSRDVIERLAGALATTPEYLCFGRTPDRRTIPVMGAVGASRSLDATPLPTTAFLSLHDEIMLAYEVADDGMSPVFKPGQRVLIARYPAATPEVLLGRHALVELPDGRALLRRPFPCGEPGCYDLAAYAAPTLRNVRLAQARAVLGMLENEAVTPTERGEENSKRDTLMVDKKFT